MSKFIRLAFFSAIAAATLSASSVHSASITVTEEVHAGATAIPPGQYSLHWSADTGDTDVTVSAGKHQYSIPVTISAGSSKGGDAILTHSDDHGTSIQAFKVKNVLLTVR
jgi:hypothetical protein